MNAQDLDTEILTASETEVVIEQTNYLNCFQRLCNVIKQITLEPCVLLFFMAYSMGAPMQTAVMVDKVCIIKYNYSTEICNNLSNYKNEQMDVQREASRLGMYSSIIENLPKILFVLFLGSWSDKHGRKIPLILPFIGGVLYSFVMWVNIRVETLPPEFLLFAALPHALTGGIVCLIMSMYAYVSDITTIKTRTTRIAFYDMFLMIGPPCGILLSNVTVKNLGFGGSFLIVGFIFAICIVYIIIRIKETRGCSAISDNDQELQLKSNSKLADLCNWRNVKETFITTFQKRPNYGRTRIILLMLAICLMVMEFNTMGLELLYTEFKFNWTYEQYANWIVTTMALYFLGMIIFFPILSYKMGVQDEVLGIIGGVSGVILNIFKALANKGYMMYIGSLIGMVKGVPLVVGRSLTSKIVPDSDAGKVFSVLASFECIIPLVSTPFYTYDFILVKQERKF
ncbi:Solute carrier family 46 member 3 [Armadillidium vulgare]|nr:Solute carrier family 46 member 3 [Armadillidium vulgare]